MDERTVTPAQVVAYNMRRWRLAAGLTQAELGRRLGGWSVAMVSAAERTWDGGRPRSFDAATLLALATALGVPLIALFLPPEGEGTTARYVLPGHGPLRTMPELMARVVMPDNDNQTPAMGAYRLALVDAVQQLLDPGWGDDVAHWLTSMGDQEIRAERAARLRVTASELIAVADAMEGGEPGG